MGKAHKHRLVPLRLLLERGSVEWQRLQVLQQHRNVLAYKELLIKLRVAASGLNIDVEEEEGRDEVLSRDGVVLKEAPETSSHRVRERRRGLLLLHGQDN